MAMETVTYENGVNGVNFYDAYITDDPDSGSGSGTPYKLGVVSGKTGNSIKRSIFQVDISDIPKSATIFDASLALNVTATSGTDAVQVHGMISGDQDWDKNDIAYPKWSNKSSSTAWSVSGGGRKGAVLNCGTLPTSTGTFTLDLTYLVSRAYRYEGKVMNICLFLSNESLASARNITFKTSSASSNKPVLTVKYVEGLGVGGKTRLSQYRTKSTRRKHRK
tara:strand:+ start:1081 stop:1743 length:663 start_codon:yes stop_codon:yes gene_type:complete